MTQLTISQLAKIAHVNAATIRYYERRQLIQSPIRSASGYRLYSDEAAQRINAIKKAKSLGFTLDEIAELFSLQTNPELPCATVKTITANKIKIITEKIKMLTAMQKALQKLHDECTQEFIKECPILDALNTN